MNILFVILVIILVMLAKKNRRLNRKIDQLEYMNIKLHASAEELWKLHRATRRKLDPKMIQRFNTNVNFKTIMRSNKLL